MLIGKKKKTRRCVGYHFGTFSSSICILVPPAVPQRWRRVDVARRNSRSLQGLLDVQLNYCRQKSHRIELDAKDSDYTAVDKEQLEYPSASAHQQ